MTPQPDEEAAARAWRAEVRLKHELVRAGIVSLRYRSYRSFRNELLASSGHFALIVAGARWGQRS